VAVPKPSPLQTLGARIVRFGHNPRALFIVIVAAAAALRFVHLGSDSLWFDEAISLQVSVHRAFSETVHLCAIDTHSPLYFVILNVWLRIAGDGDVAARIPSAVFGLATVSLVFAVGRRWFGDVAGALAGWMLAFSTLHLYYSQEARPYALLMLLSGASMAAALEWMSTGARGSAAVYILTTALACYTHVYGFFVPIVANVAVLGVALVHRKEMQSKLPLWAVAQVGVGLSVAPWLPTLQHQVGAKVDGTSGAAWIPPPQPFQAREALTGFGNGYTVVVLGAIALLALTVLRRRAPSRASSPENPTPKASRALLLSGLWLGGYLVIPYLVSLLVTPIYQARYLSIAAPAFVLVVAGAVTRLPGVARLVAVAVVMVAMAPDSLKYHQQYPHKQRYRDAAAYVKEHARPQDAVILPHNWAPFAHYFASSNIPMVALDEWTDPPVISPIDRVDAGEPRRSNANQPLDAWRASYDGLWVAGSNDEVRALTGRLLGARKTSGRTTFFANRELVYVYCSSDPIVVTESR
jgi:mannosyltransferase